MIFDGKLSLSVMKCREFRIRKRILRLNDCWCFFKVYCCVVGVFLWILVEFDFVFVCVYLGCISVLKEFFVFG